MKIEKLYYFLSVAKHRNFTKAAQECHIAQPAISKQMLSLEKELGFLLFERKNRRVELTEAGKEFYQSISCLIDEYEASVRRVQQLPEEASHLCVGISALSDKKMLSIALQQLKEQFPRLEIEMKTVCASAPSQWLTEDACDIAFTWSELTDLPESIESCVIAERSCQVLLNQRHPLAEKETLSCSDLAGQGLLIPACPHCQRFTQFYMERMRSLGIPVVDTATARDTESLFFMLEGNVGVAVVPKGAFDGMNASVVSKTLEDCQKFGQWKALYRRENSNQMIHSLLGLLIR